MTRSKTHLRGLRGALGVLAALLNMPHALAETTDERLQRLEREIRELRQELHEQQETKTVPTPMTQTLVATPDVARAQTGVFIRYYIQTDRLGEQPPTSGSPAVEGRISDVEALSFDPASYDVPNAGLFSDYRDPATYRYIGVDVQGDLPVRNAGEYEFVVYPKPAREGGANVSTKLSVWLSVDGKPVVEFRDESSWQVQRGKVRLEPGMHQVRMWAVAASSGFGPSPTATRVLLALKGPGDASPRPMRDLFPPTGME